MIESFDFTQINLITDNYEGITIDNATIPNEIVEFEQELIIIIDKLKNYELVNNYYINQNIVTIKKNNLSYDVIGQIIYIKNKKLGIKLKNNIVIYINPTLYYTFIKFNKNNNKQFFQQLLKNL